MSIEILFSRDVNNSQKLGNALLQTVEDVMDIKRLGFYCAYTNFEKINGLVAIFNSSFCKIGFTLSRQQLPQHDELSIEYGRLHASNDDPFMEWQGKKCRSWHKITEPIRYLDGLSPVEAMQQAIILKQSPQAIEKFRHSEYGHKLLDEYPPKYVLTMHSILLENYGHRLFELFDLRRPELWEKYTQFIKGYYRLIGLKARYGPPYENIC